MELGTKMKENMRELGSPGGWKTENKINMKMLKAKVFKITFLIQNKILSLK